MDAEGGRKDFALDVARLVMDAQINASQDDDAANRWFPKNYPVDKAAIFKSEQEWNGSQA